MTTLKDFIGLETPSRADLSEREKVRLQNLGVARNERTGELIAIARQRVLTAAEAGELKELAEFLENTAGPTAEQLLFEADEVKSLQRRLVAAAIRAAKKRPKPPETIREFKNALINIGFSSRAAERVSRSGFKIGAEARDE